MNKNIIKVVALALAISGAATLTPTELNLGTKVAYADSNSSDLSSLKLMTSSGTTIRLYSDNDYSSDSRMDPEDIKSGIPYYAKTSAKTVKFKIDGVDTNYVKVFYSQSNSSKGRTPGSSFSLDSGTNKIIIRVYSEDPGDNPRYDDNSYKLDDYTVKIKCTADDSSSSDSSSSDSSNNNDDIYLDDLTLTNSDGDDIDIGFDQEKTSYDVDVKKDINYVRVSAQPEDDSYDVEINDSAVKSDKDYEKKVNLDTGENKVVVKITDDEDNERDYTLNITREGSSSTDTSTNTSTNTSTDSTSTNTSTNTSADNTNTSNTNSWSIQDGKVYYLDSNGTKKTGWLPIGSDWYYLDSNGVRKTGWQNVNGNWYYLDEEGKMQTGWFKDWNGTWYYLNPDSNGSKGAMLHDTYVGGYRLGSDGAWVK